MKVIARAKLEKIGNDCLIERVITVVEVLDAYFTFTHTRYCGLRCDGNICEDKWEWNNKEEALESFKITIEQNKDYIEEIHYENLG